MDLKKSKRVIYGLLIAAFILLACAFAREDLAEWFLYGFMGLMGIFGVCIVLFWRCPHCGKHLGRLDNAKYCMHCGERLYGE